MTAFTSLFILLACIYLTIHAYIRWGGGRTKVSLLFVEIKQSRFPSSLDSSHLLRANMIKTTKTYRHCANNNIAVQSRGRLFMSAESSEDNKQDKKDYASFVGDFGADSMNLSKYASAPIATSMEEDKSTGDKSEDNGDVQGGNVKDDEDNDNDNDNDNDRDYVDLSAEELLGKLKVLKEASFENLRIPKLLRGPMAFAVSGFEASSDDPVEKEVVACAVLMVFEDIDKEGNGDKILEFLLLPEAEQMIAINEKRQYVLDKILYDTKKEMSLTKEQAIDNMMEEQEELIKVLTEIQEKDQKIPLPVVKKLLLTFSNSNEIVKQTLKEMSEGKKK